MTWIELLSRTIRDIPVEDRHREDVDALFTFHRAVNEAAFGSESGRGGSSRGTAFGREPGATGARSDRAEAFRLLAGSLVSGNFDRHLRFPVDAEVVRAAFDAAGHVGGEGGALAPMCERAAEMLEGRIPADETELRSFLDDWSGETALLVARAMGVRGSWQRRGVLSTARAQTLAKHLCRLERDLSAGFILFPRTDLERFGVPRDRIADSEVLQSAESDVSGGGARMKRAGTVGSGNHAPRTDRLVWKQIIRIQEALSGVVDLVADLENRPARRLRRWWFAVIELTHATGKVEYDAHRLPREPTRLQRVQIAFQSLFGRTTFRA